MIPKLIHRIWLGGPVPVEAAGTWARWRSLFPDYDLVTWQEPDLAALGMPPEFGSARTYAERSDIARLRVLNARGGVYADCDVAPLRRFDHLWTRNDRLVAFEMQPGEVITGCMAAAPGALDFLVRFVEQSARTSDPHAAPSVRTGPVAVAAGLSYVASRDATGLRLYPPAFVSFAGTDRTTYMNLADDHPDAVVHTLLRSPPDWKQVERVEPTRRRCARTKIETARLLPLRATRKLRRLSGGLG